MPTNLAQYRVFRGSFLTRQTDTGEQCSPLQEFFDSLGADMESDPNRRKTSLCETDSPDTGEVALAPEGERCPEGAERENLAIARNILGNRTVLSPTACGRSPLAEGAKV